MRLKFLLALLFALASKTFVFAQIGVDNVAPISTFPNDTIVITGSGFSANMADLEVWFGPVQGTIMTSSELAIEVKVPPQARATNITVVNKVTRLSAMSEMKFIPRLKTEPFSASKFVQAVEFQPQVPGAQTELWDLCLCDLDVDGKPDIASSKFARPGSPYLAANDIMILKNNSTPGNISTGTFTKIDRTTAGQAVLNLGFATDNIVCGDLNGDGKPELVVSRGSAPRNSIHIFRNQSTPGTISFVAPVLNLFLDVGHVATRIVIRDLNNDGKPELLVTNSANDIFYIFANQSSGGTVAFNATPIKLDLDPAATSTSYDFDVQDFNNDGWADIVVNRFVVNNFYIFKNLKSSTISFAAPVVHSTVVDDVVFNRVQSADFNKDGKLDLIFTNSSPTGAKLSAIYMNQSTAGGNITFTPDASATKFLASDGAWGIDIADIDGDEDVDFVIAPFRSNELNVYLHNGNTTTPAFTKQVIPLTTPAPWFPRNVKVADLDGDGRPEITFTAQNDGSIVTALEVLKNTHCHQPVIENAEPMTICNGQTLVLKAHQAPNPALPANGTTTFEWKKDGVVVGTNSPFLTINGPGTYRVTNTANTCNLFDEIVVSFDNGGAPVDPPITANSPLCVGSTLNLSTNTVPGATYTWTRPDGTTITGTTAAEEDPSFTVDLDDAGMYSLQVQVGQCKSDIVTKRVDVANLSNFSISANPATAKVCQGGQITLSVSNLANHQYDWKRNGISMGLVNTTTSINVTDEASYVVAINNTLLSCNTETSAVATTVLSSPVPSYSVPATGCVGTAVSFNNTSTFDNRGTISYSWNFGQAPGSTDINPTKTYTSAGPFNTTLTASYSDVSGTGCSVTTSPAKQIVISATVVPTIVSEKTSLCPDETSVLSVAGTFNSITWSNSATGASTTVTGPATYTVNTVDANSCPGTDDIVIAASVVPTVTAMADPPTIKMGSSTQLQATGTDIEAYSWSPADNLTNPNAGSTTAASEIENPKAAPQITTTYTVTVTGPDPDAGGLSVGCTASADIEVVVSGVAGFPVAFSPNNDGIKDVWDIGATLPDKAECTLAVFDARGRRIFEGKGVNWDGKYQNNDVPAGTYYYVFGCPDEEPITGHVLVIR